MSAPYACPNCGTTDEKRFHKNRSRESGLQTHCYKCQEALWGNRHVALALQRKHEAEAEAREASETLALINERLDEFVAQVSEASFEGLVALESKLRKVPEPTARKGEARAALDARLLALSEAVPIIRIDTRDQPPTMATG